MTDPVAVHEQARFTYLRSFPHSGGPTVLLIFLSKRYQGNPGLPQCPIGRLNHLSRCLKGLIELFDYLDEEWWVEEDLNLRPHAYQACALTT